MASDVTSPGQILVVAKKKTFRFSVHFLYFLDPITNLEILQIINRKRGKHVKYRSVNEIVFQSQNRKRKSKDNISRKRNMSEWTSNEKDSGGETTCSWRVPASHTIPDKNVQRRPRTETCVSITIIKHNPSGPWSCWIRKYHYLSKIMTPTFKLTHTLQPVFPHLCFELIH